ncbi:3'-5' exonuclease [Dimargaris verticillata]|uniref:RNA exonuclease 4 n=1 Tax=Dimargaris verticillata TaxID=2761393 RepID=A0A9W8BA60_9FUNG|nr:3'-5' exonuclease [Dimargaris verticillata]
MSLSASGLPGQAKKFHKKRPKRSQAVTASQSQSQQQPNRSKALAPTRLAKHQKNSAIKAAKSDALSEASMTPDALKQERAKQASIAALVLKTIKTTQPTLDLSDDELNKSTTNVMTVPAAPPSSSQTSTSNIAVDVNSKQAALTVMNESAVLKSLFAQANKRDGMEGSTNDRLKVGKYLAIDCEMVGVGPDGTESVLARISLVNFYGQVVLDRYVRPSQPVTDYRTAVSGITAELLIGARSFNSVVKDVQELVKDRILVGHSIKNDLDVLQLEHPRTHQRDIAVCASFCNLVNGRRPSLKFLAQKVLGITIQVGSHSSVSDARVAMLLYRKVKAEFDKQVFSRLSTQSTAGPASTELPDDAGPKRKAPGGRARKHAKRQRAAKPKQAKPLPL